MSHPKPNRGVLALLTVGCLSLAVAVASCRSGEPGSGGRGVKSAPASTAPTTRPSAVTVPERAEEQTGEWAVAYARTLGFLYPAARNGRTGEEVGLENQTCLACHQSDDHDMHAVTTPAMSCTDCHGGEMYPRGFKTSPAEIAALGKGHATYQLLKNAAHVRPKLAEFWAKSAPANPQTAAAKVLREDVNYIRFVNPGDLRAAHVACGACHNQASDGFLVDRVHKSMMAHGAMLWGAALYNNGAVNRKIPVYGEIYGLDGTPSAVFAAPKPTKEQTLDEGLLSFLYPLPRWEVTQPGNVLRVFEQGGRRRPILGVPDPLEEPGRPEVKLSVRGFGTDVRTDPVFIGLQKTRLLDPTLNLFGTNDHPGDYRASGCSACHVVYANDRSPVHSAGWAKYGNRGQSFSTDAAVNDTAGGKERSGGSGHGQPVRHQFVDAMPNSTCISCHIHPGTNVLNSYLGFMWWDNETDGRHMYPKKQRYPTADQEAKASRHNPEGAAARGLWSGLYPNAESHAGRKAGENFLADVTSLNPDLSRTQFADFHGHGWTFRAVFKQDRRGNMLDRDGDPIEEVTAAKMAQGVDYRWKKAGDQPPDGAPVHLKDVHLEMGMHCVDCHFDQDNHGNGNLYGETRSAVMVACEDCHGTVEKPPVILQWLQAEKDRSGRSRRGRGGDQGEKGGADDKEQRKLDLLAGAFTGTAADDVSDPKALLARNRKLIEKRFKHRRDVLRQESAIAKAATVWKDGVKQETPKEWEIVQTRDTALAGSKWSKANPQRAEKARYAHTVLTDGTWDEKGKWDGTVPEGKCSAHANVACYTCHTSWNTSCFGCHLPMRANQRTPMLHNEGLTTRNYTNYNFQTLRDDVFMIGVDATVQRTAKGGGERPRAKIVPVRSACAVLVSSQDANRQWIYTQQQTISAEGFAGTAFSPYFPHTVRATETRQCTDCHISKDGDNNAVMANLLLQGSNSVNFIGRFAWVGMGSHGVQAVAVTEREEPQAVIGSRLHELAYPDFFRKHQQQGGRLAEAYEHGGTVLDLQLRGEYLYAACGPKGFIAYDVANIDNKGFSERIVTAPVSPLGQRFFVDSKYATSICSPSTMALDPTRPQRPENEEQSVHPLYAYLYLTDREEGLIVIGNPPGSKEAKKHNTGVATLLDGNPQNNFLRRALTFNPGKLLQGARHMALWGTYAFVTCDAGVVVLDLNDPLRPQHVRTLGADEQLNRPRKVAFQFQYAFVLDADGVKVLDVFRVLGITDKGETPLPVARVRIPDARDLYISRTYGYVAAGAQGLVVIDFTRPRQPVTVIPSFTADGKLTDATAVRVGMTNASLFAYVADGRYGLKVLQLTSPEDNPTYLGYSPRPTPRLIAHYPTEGPAVALSEGLDRDRAVDETGNQLSVFGRRGARPFNFEEQQRLYLRTLPDGTRSVYQVSDDPSPTAARPAGTARADRRHGSK